MPLSASLVMTPLCRRLDLTAPVVQAPVGSATTPELAAAVSTFWGDPRPYVDRIHAAGALHLHTVGSAEEARRAVQAGVDVIVAQGWEAGGRVWGDVATLPLVAAVVDAVRPVPVIVADGRGLAAVLVL